MYVAPDAFLDNNTEFLSLDAQFTLEMQNFQVLKIVHAHEHLVFAHMPYQKVHQGNLAVF